MQNDPVQVYVVDDQPSVCTAYIRLLRSAGMKARSFGSVEEFLLADVSDDNACVVSDVWMPGASGLELPGMIAKAGRRLPVILVTASDLPATHDIAQRSGASAFFRKPVDGEALIDAIAWAISHKAGG